MSMLLSESKIRNVVRSVIKSSIDRLDRSKITVGDRHAFVEVACDESSISRGLMFRTSLERDSGMLFIFEDCQPRSFWMKNTFIPLSIAYANSDGMILNISEMSPLALDRVLSSGPAKYALEMPAGWFKENNIFPGDKIVL